MLYFANYWRFSSRTANVFIHITRQLHKLATMTNQFTVLADNPVIEKPLLDDRSYRLVKLKDNNLTVLLISDPTADKSAASLDVRVGSFADKQYGISGLAHFCEHLLFMGTEKYPKENEYSNYLSKHSGHSNAYTAAEHTNYYFQVGSDYLEGALDRFAQFSSVHCLAKPVRTVKSMLLIQRTKRIYKMISGGCFSWIKLLVTHHIRIMGFQQVISRLYMSTHLAEAWM